MLAIRSDAPLAQAPALPATSFPDVCATMAHWLGVRVHVRSGIPIAPLVG